MSLTVNSISERASCPIHYWWNALKPYSQIRLGIVFVSNVITVKLYTVLETFKGRANMKKFVIIGKIFNFKHSYEPAWKAKGRTATEPEPNFLMILNLELKKYDLKILSINWKLIVSWLDKKILFYTVKCTGKNNFQATLGDDNSHTQKRVLVTIIIWWFIWTGSNIFL